MTDDGFRFEYRPGTVRYGDDCTTDLGDELDRVGATRALVVCGRTVGSTPGVMDPVREGLGDRLVGVFDRTTPQKTVATALDAAERARDLDADVLVGVGGGSSLDTAKVAAALVGDDRSRDSVVEDLVETGGISVAGDPPAVAAVPTTLTGADLSSVAGITVPADLAADAAETNPEGTVHGGTGDPRLFPEVACYDPELFRTTPHEVLTGSAMNGFDKAVETPYARTATPVSDATAVRALRLLRQGLPALGRGKRDDETMRQSIVGTVLAQYGVSRPDATTLSLIHAFGHAIGRPYDVQQGAAHAIAVPHVLRYLFDRTDARRDLLAEGLGIETEGRDDETVATGVIDAVREVRDALDLPARLGEVPGIERDDVPGIARAVVDDGFTPNAPVTPTVEEMEEVLHEAW